jgi:signal transduction histidine kinase
MLSDNRGRMPSFFDDIESDIDEMMKQFRGPRNMSRDQAAETRFFSVLLDSNGNAVFADVARISAVDEEEAAEYAVEAIEKEKSKGFIDNYRYGIRSEGLNTRVTFIDCTRMLWSFKRFLLASVAMSVAGLAVIFVIICYFAGRIVRPVAESYEKQKRFITDAGHEIKTPLTIINANIDLLEMELGENENLDEVRLQSQRLTTLTNELVLLARMEEADRKLQMIEFPVSEITEEVVSSFKSLLIAQEKCVHINVTPMLAVKGDAKAYERLVSVLLDNAVKYSPKGGNISVSLSKHARGVLLTVENDTADKIDQKSFEHIFERFYRIDSSRNSETGGHGIGLSLAHAIVTAHGGKITPFSKEENSFGVNVYLP